MPNAVMLSGPWTAAEIRIPNGVGLRPITEADLESVGHAYWRTYFGTTNQMTSPEAAEDIMSSWRGVYGRWLTNASLGAWCGDELVGAILTVSDAPWPDIPKGAFIIDLFVIPQARRRGVGRVLVQAAWAECPSGLSLRVDATAVEASALYTHLGFTLD